MAHPDEVVKPAAEVESKLVSEARLRHELAKGEAATPQEKKQAEVEQAHALSTRPDGSYAQLHETEEPKLAVADSGQVRELKKEHDRAVKGESAPRDDTPIARGEATPVPEQVPGPKRSGSK